MKDTAELCRGLLRKAKSDRIAIEASLATRRPRFNPLLERTACQCCCAPLLRPLNSSVRRQEGT